MIKIDEKNYRLHGDKNKRIIKKSLEDCGAFKAICQNTVSVTAFKNSSLVDMMTACTKDRNMIMQLIDK